MFKCNMPESFRRYVTMYETWLHYFTPKSNRQSTEWTTHDEPAPKREKTQQSAEKVMASVFWDFFIDYLDKGRTINSDYNIELLGSLKARTQENGGICHQDNAP